MKHNFEENLQEAKEMFAYGHDSKYIEFQLAEKGVPDEMIDEIITAIKKLRKEVKKSIGMKQVVYGLSFIAAAFLFTFISTDENSPVVYVLWGLAIVGVLTTLKGVANVLDLL